MTDEGQKQTENEVVDESTKQRALIGLGVAVVVTIGAWFFVDSATDRGIERLNHIERVYAVCQQHYAVALNNGDTSRVDNEPLSAAIDSGKAGAPTRCGELRRREGLAAEDSARKRQMNRGTMPVRDGR